MARQETGTTPSKAVERLRIEVARLRVQSSSEAIERVAQVTGFRDPERMRRAFGQPPQSLRGAGGVGTWLHNPTALADVRRRSKRQNPTCQISTHDSFLLKEERTRLSLS
jgi:AraC-like DNA-binding protein